MTLSVIIPTYNEADFITQVVEKIRNFSRDPVEEIIDRTVFFQLQGFRENYFVMEDQEMVRQIKQSH